MSIQLAIKNIADGLDIRAEIAKGAIYEIMEGKATDVQIAAFLMGLKLKGETATEVVAMAEAMMEKAVTIRPNVEICLDTCGTGGDGQGTFNISTTVAFVCAACGVPVAKHGNRSVSSTSGSADVLEALGAKIDIEPEHSKQLLEKIGFAFLFAPLYHPGMRYAAKVRKELGVRTIFNFLGPILNPAFAQLRCVGVSSKGHLEIIAKTLQKLGVKRAVVYHSEDGLDEISLNAPTTILDVFNDKIDLYEVEHSDFGLEKRSVEEIIVSSPQESANLLVSVLKGENTAALDYVLASSATALYVAGVESNFKDGVEKARSAIIKGAAIERLREYIELTGGEVGFS